MAKPRKPKPKAAPTTQPAPAAPAAMAAPSGFIRGTAHAQRAGRKGGSARKEKPTAG